MGALWPGAAEPFAHAMNEMPQGRVLVPRVSADWGETTIVGRDLIEALTWRKRPWGIGRVCLGAVGGPRSLAPRVRIGGARGARLRHVSIVAARFRGTLARMEPPPRRVTLVLCRSDGTVLGALAPFTVEVPWWQEAGPVVRRAREEYGVEVTMLRLLRGANPPAGGPVTYLAEVGAAPTLSLDSWAGPALGEHPLRLPYARPGGPRADVAWAERVLVERGTPRSAPAEQMRTWNLSSVWRLPPEHGAAWLKVVPPFFAHEGAMLARLDRAVVPPLIAADGPRMLLDEVPGEDQWNASLPRLLAMVGLLVGLQAQWSTRLHELADLPVPDWRPAAFVPVAADVVTRTAAELDAGARRVLERLVEGLPARFRAVADCGVPESLVHGDF